MNTIWDLQTALAVGGTITVDTLKICDGEGRELVYRDAILTIEVDHGVPVERGNSVNVEMFGAKTNED